MNFQFPISTNSIPKKKTASRFTTAKVRISERNAKFCYQNLYPRLDQVDYKQIFCQLYYGLIVPCTKTKKPSHRILMKGLLSWKVAASYSPALHCSTIGAGGLNFSVRNGKRWDPAAITTWYRLLTISTSKLSMSIHNNTWKYELLFLPRNKHLSGESYRAISKARLWRHRLYTCLLSTSSSGTTLMEFSSCGRLRT